MEKRREGDEKEEAMYTMMYAKRISILGEERPGGFW
jgi:hypothetical protein